jgi:Helix-turn-helix domain
VYLDGPSVVASARVAARIHGPLKDLVRAAHLAGHRFDDDEGRELVRFVADCERAARSVACSAGGTSDVPHADGSGTVRWMTSKQVAARLGVGVREVTALANRGSLPGLGPDLEKGRRAWMFAEHDVDAYRAARDQGAVL